MKREVKEVNMSESREYKIAVRNKGRKIRRADRRKAIKERRRK
jgi:hypothetical protein